MELATKLVRPDSAQSELLGRILMVTITYCPISPSGGAGISEVLVNITQTPMFFQTGMLCTNLLLLGFKSEAYYTIVTNLTNGPITLGGDPAADGVSSWSQVGSHLFMYHRTCRLLRSRSSNFL